MRGAWSGLLAVCVLASDALAQRPEPAGIRGLRAVVPAAAAASPAMMRCPPSDDETASGAGACEGPAAWSLATPADGTARGSAWSIAASAVVPGAGQAMLGSLRFAPYVAVEVLGWVRYADHAGDARTQRDAYRRLAAEVARAPFSSSSSPPVGDFDYYERLEHFLESGRFDAVSGGGLDPETDTLTYNGFVWQLARRTYWASPDVPPDTSSSEWKQSIDFYRRRAYDQSFRWSWTGSPSDFNRYKQLIRDTNDSHRRSIQDLGLVIANHLLSTIDAYVSVRLRRTRGPLGDGLSVRASLPLANVFPR